VKKAVAEIETITRFKLERKPGTKQGKEQSKRTTGLKVLILNLS